MGGRRLLIVATALALAAPWAVDTVGAVAVAAPGSADRQAAFARAAALSGVPEPVLLAVAYQESWWERHGGAPSTTGNYGVMGLTDVPAGAVPAKGVDGASPDSDSTSLHTLATAARLAGVSAAAARSDDATNILAGAALLASHARALGHGRLPAGVAGWYGAVARYAGTPSAVAAAAFADDVYATLARGAARQTADGQHVVLTAMPGLRPDRSAAAAPGPRPAWAAECPAVLHCDVVPAAYARNDPRDPGDYGNYDLADRPHGPTIDHIVLHDTEGSYAGALATFTNPANYVSAHYVIRSADGHVTQQVPTRDVAWHAGNWYLNMHSVGIEQEGYAVRGATWFTERLYRSSARLVRYLAAPYRIPLDRQHILGHDNVPGTIPARVARMHWDPGPFWDWNHYLALLGRPVRPTAGPGSPVVTIAPRFTANARAVTDCEGSATVPRQPASFVYLRTAPSPTAPLVGDPALHPGGAAGTTCAADWGDKASAGQQFVVAGRRGHWTAIWWDGVRAWFYDRVGHGPATVPSRASVIRPKAGLPAVAVYGRAYPEAAAYPADIPVPEVTPLQYTIAAGQSYVTIGRVPTDYYYAWTIDGGLPDDHTDVLGSDSYYQIQLGHRIGFVRAVDVDVLPAR